MNKGEQQQIDALVKKAEEVLDNEAFPFEYLPLELNLLILTYLDFPSIVISVFHLIYD